METWELIAREQIRDLVASYAHLADGGRFDALLELFAEDGVLQGGDAPEARGRAAIRAFLTGTGTDLKDVARVKLIRHHVSSVRIEVESKQLGFAWAYFLVLGRHGLDHWGRYADELVPVGDRWLLRRRRVSVDGAARASVHYPDGLGDGG